MNFINLTLIIAVILVYMTGYVIYCRCDSMINPAFMPMISISLIGLGLIVFGMLNLLYIGNIVLMSAIVIIFFVHVHRFRKKILTYAFDKATIYFCLMSLVIIFIYCNKNIEYHIWDEISHWGPFFKSIFINRKLPIYVDIAFTHGGYTQFTSVIYFFFSFWLKEFNTPSTYAVMLIMITACNTTVLYVIPPKKYYVLFVNIITLSTYLALFPTLHPYSSIYMDALVGVFGGGFIIFIYSLGNQVTNVKNYIVTCLMATAFAQIKSSGLPVVMLSCAFYFVCCLMHNERNEKCLGVKNYLYKTIFIIAGTLFSIGLYKVIFETFTKGIYVINNSESPSLIKRLEDFMANGSESYFVRFTKVFFSGLITLKIGPMPHLFWLITFLLIALFMYFCSDIERKDKIIAILLPIASIVLIFAIYIGYLVRAGEGRALVLGSFDRYSGTLLIGSMMMLFVFFIKYSSTGKYRYVYSAVLFLISSICCINFLLDSDNNYFTNAFRLEDMSFDRYYNMSRVLPDYIEPDVNLLVIAQGNDGNVPFLYRYHLLNIINVLEPGPKIPSSYATSQEVIDHLGTGGYYKVKSLEGFIEAIERYSIQYILVDYTDDVLRTGYGHLFSDNLLTAHNWTPKLYRVIDAETYELICAFDVSTYECINVIDASTE